MTLFKIGRPLDPSTEMDNNHTAEANKYFALFEKKSILAYLPNLKENEDFSYFTKGLNTHEVLVKLLEIAGPADVAIANYSLTELPMRVLSQLKEKGAIKRLEMLLDKTVYRTPKLRAFAIEISDDIAFTEIHAKVILIKSEHKHLVFVSSSNLTKNHRYEVGSIIDNVSKFQFFERKIKQLIDEYRD